MLRGLWHQLGVRGREAAVLLGRKGPGWGGTGHEAAQAGQRLEPSRAVPPPRDSAEERLCQTPWWISACLNTSTVQGGGLGVASGLGTADSPERAVGAGWQDQPGRESDKMS